MRRIIAGGGDPRKQGDLYVNALNQSPTFPSLYGGNGGPTGTFAVSPTTHALTERSLAVSRANGNSAPPTLLATCGIGATNFQLMS
jgi:hypothetical protein